MALKTGKQYGISRNPKGGSWQDAWNWWTPSRAKPAKRGGVTTYQCQEMEKGALLIPQSFQA